MSEELIQKIRGFVMPCTGQMSLDLIELNVRQRAGTFIVDVIADRQQGGITLHECALLNTHIVKELERAQILGEDFEVDVASPGVDRPLKTCRDFERARGSCVRFHLRQPYAHKLEYAGIIKEVKEMAVVIDSKGQVIELCFDNIHKAVQII
jgi:ribosome maturation factor RimP